MYISELSSVASGITFCNSVGVSGFIPLYHRVSACNSVSYTVASVACVARLCN